MSHSMVKGHCGCFPALLSKQLGQLCLMKELVYPPIPLNTALMVLQAVLKKSLKNQLIQLAASYVHVCIIKMIKIANCPTLFLA